MRKIDSAVDIQQSSLKVRRDSIYCEGKIIARYDVEPSKAPYSLNDMISVYSKSGKRIAVAFAPLFEATCRVLTDSDQKEHFIQADPELKFMRVQQVVEYLLESKYL